MISNKLVIPTQRMGWDSGSILFSIIGDPFLPSSGVLRRISDCVLFGLPFRRQFTDFIILGTYAGHSLCISVPCVYGKCTGIFFLKTEAEPGFLSSEIAGRIWYT
jgi:hypothetical protein